MTYDRKDAYYTRARAAGYRARSAYKLADLVRRYRLLRRGDFVIDLGCWPGGWLQVTLEAVGAGGRVVGVDVGTVASLDVPNLVVVQGDVREVATLDAVTCQLGRSADAVLSDLAPKLTGVKSTDETRATELARATLDALPCLLRPGGHFVMKAFMNADYHALARDVRAAFATSHATRAEATRRGSAELYLVGLGFSPVAEGRP